MRSAVSERANEIMVTIATFNEPAKAKHLKERLQEAGLKADIHNEAHLQAVAFMSKPQANWKVNVDEDDFEAAQSLMVEWEATDPDVGSAIRCPQCGSSRIEYPQLTRKFHHSGAGEHSFCAENFPEGILLSGLSFHLEQRGQAAALSFLEPFLFRSGKTSIALSAVIPSASEGPREVTRNIREVLRIRSG